MQIAVSAEADQAAASARREQAQAITGLVGVADIEETFVEVPDMAALYDVDAEHPAIIDESSATVLSQ